MSFHINITVYWNVTQYNLLHLQWCCGVNCRLYLQCKRVELCSEKHYRPWEERAEIGAMYQRCIIISGPVNFHFSFWLSLLHLLQCDQQMHTFRYNYDNVLMAKFLHVSGLTGPSSGSTQLYKTNRPTLLSSLGT